MQYRKFGKLDWEVSALGFGAMRLPLIDSKAGNVDEPQSIGMIRYAIDHGVNYLDTAYPYHSGQSERIVGKALQNGYRKKMKLATKLLARSVESADDFDRYFNEQLERLQTDKLDFYLLHGLNARTWSKVRDLGVLDWAEEQMAHGRFDHLGFSFHDTYDVFRDIVDAYDNWALCQIQFNYIDKDYQAGTRGLEYAAEKGMAVVVMEPLRGGKLGRPPEQIANILANEPHQRTPAEWALQWVWNHPEVSVALSGMSTMEQVVENVASAERFSIGMLKGEEIALIDQIREAYKGLNPIPCTRCGYCMPCPNNVEIPMILGLYNDAIVYDNLRMGRLRYCGPRGLKQEQRADQCAECEECIEACPQEIPIPEWLRKVHDLLGPEGNTKNAPGL
ncbi:aldo/keto reductase [Chloroflexota bacterium]